MPDAMEILGLYHGRKNRLAATHAIFRGIRAAMLGDMDIPLPELDTNEKPFVANLILTGVTQTANRVASTMPNPFYPPLRPGIDKSQALANTRRARTLDWYDKAKVKQVMRKRALHYLTYAAAPVVVKPNPRYTENNEADQSPVLWEVRDPLATYPADMPVGQIAPDNVIFTFTRSYGWITNRYGPVLDGLALEDKNVDQEVTLLEYVDADQICLYAISDSGESKTAESGPQYGIVGSAYGLPKKPAGKPIVEVSVQRNRAARPLCTIPGQISLERPQSMYEGIVGILQMQGKMMALEVIGMQRSIWPEEWLVGRQGETPNIVTQADPIAGIMGEVSGGDIKINAPAPAQFGVNIIDRLERNARVEGGIPAEYGGESASNTRTDKRGNSILSNTIDFSIQAAHEAFQEAMREENRIAASIEREYFPGRKTFACTTGQYTYTPAELWEPNSVHWMRYSAAGSDADQLVVAGGQRLGIGTMSKKSFMAIDPLVDDPEAETEQVRAEPLEGMLFQNLTALAQADPNYMSVIAKLDGMLRRNEAPDILAAWLKLDDEYKQAQQAQQQQAAPPGAEAQPGLAQPGTIPQPGADLSNLGQLTQVLRHTSRSPAPPVPVGG